MKITTINSIEVSSLCNNQCRYCPASVQGEHRAVGLMTKEVFEAAVGWALHFARTGSQRELNLFGVGEPTLHPDLVEFVALARKRLPFRQELHLNTNGKLMTLELARALKAADISHCDITGHDAYDAAKCIRIFRETPISGQVSVDFMTQPNNWAGQVDWFAPDYDAGPCPWLARGQVMVMSNGDITRCCIDAFARGVFTNVFEDITAAEMAPFGLCEDCHHSMPEHGLWHPKESTIVTARA
jgi:hypothetical protein